MSGSDGSLPEMLVSVASCHGTEQNHLGEGERGGGGGEGREGGGGRGGIIKLNFIDSEVLKIKS